MEKFKFTEEQLKRKLPPLEAKPGESKEDLARRRKQRSNQKNKEKKANERKMKEKKAEILMMAMDEEAQTQGAIGKCRFSTVIMGIKDDFHSTFFQKKL